MAVLPINELWRIVSNDRGWVVQRYRGKRKSRQGVMIPNWQGVAWFPDLTTALENVGQRMLRSSPAVGLGEIIREAERIRAMLYRAAQEVSALILTAPEGTNANGQAVTCPDALPVLHVQAVNDNAMPDRGPEEDPLQASA